VVGLADFAIPGTVMLVKPGFTQAGVVTGEEVWDSVAAEPHLDPVVKLTWPHVQLVNVLLEV